MFIGLDNEYDDQESFDRMMHHMPAGTNMNTLTQYAQYSESGRFQYLDYGREENMERYGVEAVPDIPLEDIQVPVAFFTATSDNIVAPEDTEWLANRIETLVAHNWYRGEHMSFLIGYDTDHLPDMINVITEYTS